MAEKAYVKHLTKGGELLRAEKLDEARAELEKANQLKPNDHRILNLLGLACFRLGNYDDARTIYQQLVKAKPLDASLRMNLGLVYLKLGAADDAIVELTKVQELEPGQQRTAGYLGLAYARKGEFARAREMFLAAGQGDLAREMEEQLRGNGAPAGELQALGSERLEARPRPMSTSDGVPTPVAGGEISGPVLDAADIGAEMEEEEAAARAADDEVDEEGHRAPTRVSAFATARLIRPDDGDLPFELAAGGTLIVRVRGRLMSRTEGVIVSGGDLSYEPAAKRVRGKTTEEPFGSEGRPLFIVSGQGHLVAAPAGGKFTALKLEDDILYLREEFVFAFEEHLGWENGHVPGSGAEIKVVQFRGEGHVALRTRRAPISVKLAPEKVLYVDAGVLAGWIGRVVPRIVAPAAGGDASAPFVECTGEGVVLIEEPQGEPELPAEPPAEA